MYLKTCPVPWYMELEVVSYYNAEFGQWIQIVSLFHATSFDKNRLDI